MKKLILALLILFTPTLVLSQVAEDQIFEYKDFSGLLKSQVSPYLVDTKSAVQARNLRSNTLFGGLNKRTKMLQYGSVGAYPVKTLFRYYKSDATKHLIATGSTFMLVGNDTTGAFQTIRDELSSGKRWQCGTYKDNAICTNGTDRPQKYDGATQITADTDESRSDGILTTDLGAPFAELNTGTDLDASSWYQYKIAYHDGSTYFWSDARSNPLLTGASVYNITLTDIPPGPFGTDIRVVYRTVGNASRAAVEADTSFYRVATISDNTTTTFDDTVGDAALLGDSAPTWSTASAGTEVTPPLGKYLTIHKERLWMGNITGGKSDIYWSNSFLPDYFKTGVDFDQIRPDDGDEITGLHVQLGLLHIFKTNTIQKYKTDNTSSTLWAATDPFSFIGCPAPFTIKAAPIGLIYLGRDGLYVFNGERTELISDVVTDQIRDISQSDVEDTVGVFFDNEYQLAYTSDASGASQNDSVLLFNVVRNAYVIDDKSVDSFVVLDSGTDLGTVYSGSSLTDGNVFIHDQIPSQWIHRYKSDLDAGTTDNTVVFGTEDIPFLEMAHGVTIDNTIFAGITIDSFTPNTATIDRKVSPGYWYSQVTKISAATLDELKWNENLGGFGDATFAVRSAATEGAVSSASWSSEFTDPNNSDISGETANTWIQLRATLSTTDLIESPLLFEQDNFVITLIYNKEGSTAESSILTTWQTGWFDFGVSFHKKRFKSIEVHYIGTSGTLNFRWENSEGDIDQSFDIDLSVDPTADSTDEYEGNATEKIFRYFPPINSSTVPSPIGEFFRFTVTENGTVAWTIYRIKFKYNVEEIYE